MTPDSKQFITEVVEALADKCTRMLHHPERDLDKLRGMSHAEARGIREQCLTALHELEQLPTEEPVDP